MRLAGIGSLLVLVFLLPSGCGVPAAKFPAASTSNQGAAQTSGSALPSPQPQVPAAYRTQQVWEKALQGMTMGGAFAGIYGAGAGLVIGAITGLFTAEAEYVTLNGQIQAEQAKDKELEAKLEQELQRQRELENQLASNIVLASLPNPQAHTQAPASPNPPATGPNETVALKASAGNQEKPANPSSSPFKNVEVKDINGDTVPDLWVYYNPLKPGEMVRQEEATRGDGRVDTWSYFRDGKLVRREVDTEGRGTADTVYYYENERIAREERDENGTGHVSYRAHYQNGRRSKVEKDTRGGGRPDTWTYYDTGYDNEIVLREERDLNGDGTVDLWSHYENGRLVRRDVSAAGLELVSAQDQLPSSTDYKETPPPQLVQK